MECYALAAFRSRHAVIRFDDLLQNSGIRTYIVSTPHSISMGCGLSVRFPCDDLTTAMELFRKNPESNFIGFYRMEHCNGKIQLTAVRL